MQAAAALANQPTLFLYTSVCSFSLPVAWRVDDHLGHDRLARPRRHHVALIVPRLLLIYLATLHLAILLLLHRHLRWQNIAVDAAVRALPLRPQHSPGFG